MKNLAVILILLLTSLSSNALTIDQLLKEYRNMPDIQYEEVKGKELKALVDSVSTDVEKEALSTAKRLVVLGTVMDEDQREELMSKLNQLKDYTLGLSYSEDSKEDLNPLFSTILGLESSITVDIFSKNTSSSEYLIKPVFFINMWGMSALVYLDGKIKPDSAKELVNVTFNTEYSISPDNSQPTPEGDIDD